MKKQTIRTMTQTALFMALVAVLAFVPYVGYIKIPVLAIQATTVHIPVIVGSYEALTTEKNKRGQDVIIYTKTMDDGITFYVEEIRLGRHELAASTMYKRKKDDSPTLID